MKTNKHNPTEESIAIAKLIESKSEIDKKVEYYKSLLKNSLAIIEGANELIDFGRKTEWFSFLGIKITKNIILTPYDKAKLEKEIIEADTQMWYQQQYYENWLNRLTDYEKKWDEITAECEQNFERISEKAEQVRKANPFFNAELNKLGDHNGDRDKKNQLYLLMKQHVFNSENKLK